LSQNDPTWTARIPPDIKDYLQKIKHLSAGRCLTEYCKILKSQELPEARKELLRREKAVLQQRQKVTQLENECSTEWTICDTIFEKVSQQEDWMHKPERISHILRKNSIHSISADQFIEHYIKRGKK